MAFQALSLCERQALVASQIRRVMLHVTYRTSLRFPFLGVVTSRIRALSQDRNPLSRLADLDGLDHR